MNGASLLVLLLVAAFLLRRASTDVHLESRQWANAVGRELHKFGMEITSIHKIKKAYNKYSGVLRRRNARDILSHAVKSIHGVLINKVKAVEKIVWEAETLNRESLYDNTPVSEYPRSIMYRNAKDIETCADAIVRIHREFATTQAPETTEYSSTDMFSDYEATSTPEYATPDLEAFANTTTSTTSTTTTGTTATTAVMDPPTTINITVLIEERIKEAERNCIHFNYHPAFGTNVNKSMSTVHVPTHIYKNDPLVLHGANWSRKLDKVFMSNERVDSTLSWQYFGSADGFMRIYPGIKWQSVEKVDLYDCRKRDWYIGAAAAPEDIIILIDVSGSMTGLRLKIAKHTMRAILDTLGDNDFFNVIAYSETPTYTAPCFNGTVLQATYINKQLAIKGLNALLTKGVAHLDLALIEAFEIFQQMNETQHGAQCNRAIAVITDFAASEHAPVFEKYNWPNKTVRIFTFMIGREMPHSRELHWMSCANRGYYSHVDSIADVQEHVQDFVPVYTRGTFEENLRRVDYYTKKYVENDFKKSLSVWTSVFLDAGNRKGEYHLAISVSQPVFNITRKNDTQRSDKVLLGVAGTDVPLKQLRKFLPPHQLGVHGYSFAINNNGFLLYHPDLRPFRNSMAKPHYETIDLGEVELNETLSEDREELLNQFNIPLRTNMVNREVDSIKMTVKQHFDGIHRVRTIRQKYFYAPVEDSPFSFAIAVPTSADGLFYFDWSDSYLQIIKERGDRDIPSNLKLKVAKWIYCDFNVPDDEQDGMLNLMKTFEHLKNGTQLFEQRCRPTLDLIKNAIVDSAVIDEAEMIWFAAEEHKDSKHPRHHADLLLMGTNSGLTVYWVPEDDQEDNETQIVSEYVRGYNETIEELYYRRAVDVGEDNFVFWTPFSGRYSAPDKVIYGATAVWKTFTDEANNHERNMSVATVLFQIKYDSFHEIIFGKECKTSGKSCETFCSSGEWRCHLIDEHGYVLASNTNDDIDIGKFYGMVDENEMDELISTRNVYFPVYVADFQGVCEKDVTKHVESTGHTLRSSVLLPLRMLQWIVVWFFSHTVNLLTSLSLASVWSPNAILSDASSVTDNVGYFAYINLGRTPPRVTITPCDKEVTLYNLNDTAVAMATPIEIDCGDGDFENKTIVYHKVPHTNLLLVAVKPSAACHDTTPMTPVEIHPIAYSPEEQCNKLRLQRFRNVPRMCHWTESDLPPPSPQPTLAGEPADFILGGDPSYCGRAGQSPPSGVAVLVFLLFACLLNN